MSYVHMQEVFRSYKSMLINVLCLLLVLIELLEQTISECVSERVCPCLVCVVKTNIEPVSRILNNLFRRKKWENVYSCIHPHFIRVSFRLGKRSDESSTCRRSCHPEKSSWLTSDTRPSVNPRASSWPWWRSWGVPDLVLVCPLCFFFLFRCHAPCGDTGPVSRFSVSGDHSAWWVRWEKRLITKLYLWHSRSTVIAIFLYFCILQISIYMYALWVGVGLLDNFHSQSSYCTAVRSLQSLIM